MVQQIVTAADLAYLQAEAESMMTLTIEAFAPGGSTTTDADGMTSTAGVSQGTCPGKVQGSSVVGKVPESRAVSVGDVQVPIIDGGLHVPIGALVDDTGLLIKAGRRGTGWEFVVTAIDVAAGDDPALLGRRYLAVSVPVKSRATARRLDVVEIPQ